MTDLPASGPLLSAPIRAVYGDFLGRCHRLLGPEAAARVRRAADARVAAIKAGRLGGNADDPLEARWYASLAAGRPDFGVYDDQAYLAEAWACWAVYARHYLKLLATSPAMAGLGRVRSVADVGCGIGYSCGAWLEIAPRARVVGTNFPASPQGLVAADLGAQLGFRLLPALDGPAEVLFASEYFEHFPAPVDHLAELLAVARPRVVIVANTFGSPSCGHFPAYEVDGKPTDGRGTSVAFAKALRGAGFRKLETGFWNSRPALWERRD